MAIADLDAPPESEPRRLGRYLALRRLAVGGMAELILAEATRAGDFRKLVAIKRLLPQHARDPQLRHMFLDEARLMARMSHPNIPQVYDICEMDEAPESLPGAGDSAGRELAEGQLPYFILEYVHGRDLRAVLNQARGALPLGEVLAIGAAVAAGLHHAHELRADTGEPLEVVHRDVSPSNVLISFDGVVKLTDFGVAKWSQQRSLTVQGQLKGKFAHMSPEQCYGHALDRRSDVFALGTLLYEMAFGAPAFAASSDYEIMSQIVRGDVQAPSSPRALLPEPLVAIILRTLRRSRDERYPTAQAVQLALESFGRAEQLSPSTLATASFLESLFGGKDATAEPAGVAALPNPVRAPAVGHRARDHTLTDANAPPVPVARRPRWLGVPILGAVLLAAGLASEALLLRGRSPSPTPGDPARDPVLRGSSLGLVSARARSPLPGPSAEGAERLGFEALHAPHTPSRGLSPAVAAEDPPATILRRPRANGANRARERGGRESPRDGLARDPQPPGTVPPVARVPPPDVPQVRVWDPDSPVPP